MNMRQIPNMLGLFRVILTPILVYLLLLNTGITLFVAAWVLLAMAISDIIDGRLARRYGVVSNLGIFLDTISDKIFVAGALLPMVETGLVQSWYALIIIAREFAVSGLRSYAAAQGIVIPARSWGKQKLTITVTGLIWLMCYAAFPDLAWMPWWMIWLSQWWYIPYALALFWTVGSGIEYFWNARDLLKKAL